MKIFSAEQIRKADRYTLQNDPVNSLELMERASTECFKWIMQHYGNKKLIYVVCGKGNNGGDGQVIARLLLGAGKKVKVFVTRKFDQLSPDHQANFLKLESIDKNIIHLVEDAKGFPDFQQAELIIDAIFGTGLDRMPEGTEASIIKKINESGTPVVSIDMPSGLFSYKSSIEKGHVIIKAADTLTFQYLKPALMVSENSEFFGSVTVLNIGLLPGFEKDEKEFGNQVDFTILKNLLLPRPAFSHKGSFGHSLLIGGSKGKMGALIIAAKANLRSGSGLLTVHIPSCGYSAVQSRVPEAMSSVDPQENIISKLPELDAYDALGIGPGIGTAESTATVLKHLIQTWKGPLVIDADGLNIISTQRTWLNFLPPGTILTPHPGEFKRLAGGWDNDFQKLELQKSFSVKYQLNIVLKGKNTSISFADGSLYFNPTGNSGMAKGGTGDALTGLITGLTASGYAPSNACILGVFLHGLAGDLAASENTQEGMTALDLIAYLTKAWKKIYSETGK